MRLIDADEFPFNALIHWFETSEDEKYVILRQKQINKIPTIDPIKHGHWIETHPEWKREYRHNKCSVCGMCKKSVTNYCPECGAKMDEVICNNDN